MMNYQLEIIGFNIESCILAEQAGATRIELCDNPGEGGTTPSYGFIKAAKDKLSIDIYPIIRPRGGDFFYSDDEFEIMKSEIKVCKVFGCEGIVTGILNKDGTIDKTRCKQLTELAHPLPVTFHRAFDRVADATVALEDIIECGFKRILTSGLMPTALEGAERIASLIKQANGRIIIMPGSAVRSGNIKQIAEITGAVEFHSSARIMKDSGMHYQNNNMKEQLQSVTVDTKEVEELCTILNSI